jgi:small-conductance mechanosensitive channel
MRFLRMFVVLCFLAASALEARAQGQPPPAAGPAPPTQAVLSDQVPATLMVWNRPIAVFRAPFGSNSPKQRADVSSARIEAALDRLIPEEIRYTIAELGTDRGVLVVGAAEVLFGILEKDLPQDTASSLDAAGAQAVSRLQILLRERAEQRRWPVLLRSSAEALLATVAFMAVWLASWRALQWLLARLTRAANRRIKAAAIAGIDPRPFVFWALGWLIRLIGLSVRLTAAYLWLTFVLSRFAYSRPWGRTLGGFLIDTLTRMAAAVVDHLPNLITLAVILLITRVVAAATGAWFRAVERGDLPISWLDPLAAKAARRLAVLAIWVFAITVAYPYVPGANTEAFKGVSVFVGLMVSLGSVGIVGQILGGLFVTFNRALRPGDVVKVGNVHGVVKDLGLVSVTLTTRAQEEVTIPNSVVVADAIRNFSRAPAGVVLSTSVTIGYDAPWRQVRAMLLLAAARTDGVLKEPTPVVFETALSDFYVEYELVAYGAASVPRPVLMSRLHEQILDAFNEQGVQIMSPHFEGQPDKPAIVERSKWFAAPAPKP